jgi:hypothetical protein
MIRIATYAPHKFIGVFLVNGAARPHCHDLRDAALDHLMRLAVRSIFYAADGC